MLPLSPPAGPLTLLCVGAHADDIEIGCGGTLRAWIGARRPLTVHWVVFSATPAREQEARASAERFLAGAATAHITVHHFRDGYFPYDGALKDAFEALKSTVHPDIVLTHYRHDRHQDHRTISDLTWNTFRAHLVLEYEIPKYDGDLGTPDCYVELPDAILKEKTRLLLEAFPSQRSKPWFSEETFRGLARLRGMECGAAPGYAEAFYARKLVLRP